MIEEELKKLLGKKPTYKEIAEYFGVSESAVKRYRPDRRELIKLGLWVKRAMKD